MAASIPMPFLPAICQEGTMRSPIGLAGMALCVSALLAPLAPAPAQGQALFTADITPQELRDGHIGFALKIKASAPLVYSVGMAFSVAEDTDPAFLQEKARWKIGAAMPVGAILGINQAASTVAYIQRDISGRVRRWAGFTNIISVPQAGETEIHFAFPPAQLRELLAAGLDDVRITVHGIRTETLWLPAQKEQYIDIDARLTAIPLPR